MSVFGQRMVQVNSIIDAEFTDAFDYQPMREVINADPVIDTSRAPGKVRLILLQPGQVLGSSFGLRGMHERSTSQPTIWYMARGLLIDVKRFDRLTLSPPSTYPDLLPRRYEVADGPRMYGYGRYTATVVEIPVIDVIDEIPF